MSRSLFAIISLVALDAIGIGLIFPILPALLRELTGSGEISAIYGVIIAVYALMQFIFAPILGMLSDRFGRRPVLIVSLVGATIDYLVMAFTPMLWVLVLGRVIAGISGANMSVASAYIADTTAEKDRAQRFGWMSAAFGVGFIVGPLLGGLLGEWFVRAPFLAAAILNGLNLLLVVVVIREKREPKSAPLDFRALNPFAPLRWALSFPALAPLMLMFLIYALNGNIPGTIWVLYGTDKFGWDGLTVGLSLSVFGLCHAGTQAVLTGPITKWLGESRTIIVSVLCDATAFIVIGLANAGWVAFALAPLFALGGLSAPALQSLMSAQAGEDRQGELQGVLASANGLTSVLGPLIGTTVYFWSKPYFPGAVWLLAAAFYALSFPIMAAFRRRPPAAA